METFHGVCELHPGAAFANVLLCVATIFTKGLVIEIQNPIGIRLMKELHGRIFLKAFQLVSAMLMKRKISSLWTLPQPSLSFGAGAQEKHGLPVSPPT